MSLLDPVVPQPTTYQRFQSLDIWDQFNGASVGGDWSAANYTAWIAGIDSFLGGAATKTDRGACGDGITHIFSYAAGTGPLKVLLIAGVHADERIGQFAAMRWFATFAKSGNPVMRLLRSMLTVTYVPNTNPGSFGVSRTNPNGIDINRNFDFYWAPFSPPGPGYAKGSTAFSEVESQVIKTLIDEGNVCFIDCHNMGVDEGPTTIQVAPPSSAVTGKRALCFSAAAAWTQTYGTTWQIQDVPTGFQPTGVSWTSYYNHWVKSRWNAASVLIECNANLYGSTNTLLTRQAAQAYCGFITQFLLHWLAEGQGLPTQHSFSLEAGRFTPNDTLNIASGGTLVNGGGQDRLTFDAYSPGPAASRQFIDLYYPCPGSYTIQVNGYFAGGGGASSAVMSMNLATARPGDASFGISGTVDNNAVVGVTVPTATTSREDFVLTKRYSLGTLTGDNRLRVWLTILRNSGADNCLLRRAVLSATFHPNNDISSIAGLNG